MDEFRGWWSIAFVNRDHTDINVEYTISAANGGILFLVTFDKVYYNMNNVVSMKRKEN